MSVARHSPRANRAVSAHFDPTQTPSGLRIAIASMLSLCFASCSAIEAQLDEADQRPQDVVLPEARKSSGRDSFKIPRREAKPKKPTDHDSFKIQKGPWIEEALLDAHETESDALIIGSWNIKWFGQNDVADYDFVTMADFIEECDVVAIQEIRGANRDAVLNALMTELTNRGHSYKKSLGPETGYRNNSDTRKRNYTEHYAFLWNTDRVTMKGSPSSASIPLINNPTYRQVPYVADFEVKNANGFDFRILTTHTVYKSTLHLVRKGEIQAIADWTSTMPADGEENLIAIGDFNANPPSQTKHFKSIVKTNDLYRIPWYESASAGEDSIRTTVPTIDPATKPAKYSQLPIYDQVLISTETSDALGADPMTLAGPDFGVWEFDQDPWWDANGWNLSEIRAAVSDHRPIWFSMVFTAADNDPDQTP